MERKLKEVYPNVRFGPLSRALQNDTENVVDYNDNGLVKTSDIRDYEVVHNESHNIPATKTAASDYGTKRTSQNGVVAFPMIAVDRISNDYDFGGQGNDHMIRRGYQASKLDPSRDRSFPIKPIYQIDVISDKRVEVDEIWRELSFYLYMSPNLEVIYSEGTDREFTELFHLELLHSDNVTDVETFEDKGIIHRQTITCEVENFKLIFNKGVKLIEKIPIHQYSVRSIPEGDEIVPEEPYDLTEYTIEPIEEES